ncbi:MAG: RlmE family RNA methyltransferase [Deltaproteobacteria bacterium]|nr:MAG: RlmE family RNA methyltransferase [Deltaproteobacteria bacterium]
MYDRKDTWYRQAKKEGYRSRAAYKLTQLVAKEKAVRAGDRVIDAGAAPGGWSQVILERVGARGKVAAVDLLPVEPIPGANIRFWKRDLTDTALPAELLAFLGGKADAVVSDAAPNTTGSTFTDQARSADLVRAVFGLARETLREGGTFLAKIFGGAESDAVYRELKPYFAELRRVRPEATRKESFELYLLGKGFRQATR